MDEINRHLPPVIRVHEIRRVTKGFNCKNDCDSRTYKYLLPTFALQKVTELPKPPIKSDNPNQTEAQEPGLTEAEKVELEEAFRKHEEYRVTEDKLEQMNKLMGRYIGSRYYHNFTSGKLPLEPSARRFITKFEVADKFLMEHNGKTLEMALLEVQGQSFMLHQIRKMIGLVIAVIRDHTTEEKIEESWGTQRVDIPRAPGLGLMLDEIHYGSYNRRFADTHEKLEWSASSDAVDKFMRENVYSDIVRTEIESRNMLEWLRSLYVHSYASRHFEHEFPIDESADEEEKRKAFIQYHISQRRNKKLFSNRKTDLEGEDEQNAEVPSEEVPAKKAKTTS